MFAFLATDVSYHETGDSICVEIICIYTGYYILYNLLVVYYNKKLKANGKYETKFHYL